MREGFPRSLRLRRRGEFLHVQREGRKLHTRHFLVFVVPQSPSDRSAPARLGITVTRKVAGSVGRNRVRRRVREAFRRLQGGFPAGVDLVFIAKRDALAATYAEIVSEVESTGRRLRGPGGA